MVRSGHGHILLIRHATTNWNDLGLVQGQLDDATLTSAGRAQAASLAERLGSMSVGAIFSSDLRRARETAEPLAARLWLSAVMDRRLRERSFGALEGSPSTALSSSLTGIQDGKVVDADAAPPGGESLRQLYMRVARFLRDVLAGAGNLTALAESDDVIVVAHGGTLKVASAFLEGRGPDDMTWPEIANATVLAFPRSLTNSDLDVEVTT